MLPYILRRLLYTPLIVFGVALIMFVIFNLVGGDPTLQMLGKHATVEQQQILRAELGLDRPLPVQFLDYLKQVVTFDYGRSYATKQQVNDMIAAGVGPSMAVMVPAFTITTFLSLILALLVSYFRGKWIDKLVVVVCVIGMSAPSLAFILFGQYFLAYRLGWFPISGYESGFPDYLRFIALPSLIWFMVSLGTDVRFFRACILDETGQDYVRTARAKGLREEVVFFKHVLKNSLVPIITYVVIEIPFLILGSLLLENFFGIPGLGSITVDAVNNSDFPVIKAMPVILSLLFIFGQLLTDILYTVVDPRVSLE